METIRLKTPISYYGGKQKMLRRILPIIPEHHLYNEPFAGGAAVFFAKAPAAVEVINDTNDALITFYRVAKESPAALIERVKGTLHSRKLHDVAWTIYCAPEQYSDIDRAWSLWVLCSQGFASKIDKAWGSDKAKNNEPKKINNTKGRFTDGLCGRLERTQIECADALYVIRKYDTEGTFHYIDPPYYNSDCGSYKGYTEDNYRELLEVLGGVKGRFLLSSYPSEALKEYVSRHGWIQKKISKKVVVNQGMRKAKDKTEVLTANYAI